MEKQQKHIPFLNAGEAALHIDMSNVLAIKIKDRIMELNNSDKETREVLENYISDSLEVIIDGYVNLLQSINRGCLK
ncbi:MAG: hypothetical protein ACK5FT_08450 [Sphingomonadales bacterium]|jgi:hypothetical protein